MKTYSDYVLKSFNKNILIKIIKEQQEENQQLKEDFIPKLQWSKDRLDKDSYELQKRIDKAITLIQLIQMNDEIDWGDINTLIHILQGNKEEE